MSKLKLALDVARVGAHVVHERATKPRPTAIDEVPPSADALTLEWLTDALCREHTGARVRRVYVGARNEGSTSRRALVVDYDGVGERAGLPKRVFVKSSASFVSRLITGLTGAAAAEVGFYTQARPLLDIDAPRAYHAGWEPRSCRATLLLEDVEATRDVVWVDPRETHVDRQMAESMVTTMATYHAALWQSDRLASWRWLPSAEGFQETVNETIDFESRSMIGVDRSSEFVPSEFVDRRREIYPCLMNSLALHRRLPKTLLHQDVHLRNWYMTPERTMGLFDWQCVASGCWALDVAYALMAALTVDDRREWETDLLQLYLDRLAESGASAPDFDEAWECYRQQVFHGLIFWLYTIGSGRLQPDMQPRAVSEVNVTRMAQAVVDLRSFDSFG